MSEKTREADLKETSEQNFINYYGLKVDPLELEEPFYFFTPHLKKSLKLFNYLTSFSHKIIVTTAPQGAGKTAFLEQFESVQSSEKIVCKIKALKFDTPSQLLHEIAEKLELNVRDDVGLEKLNSTIQEYAAELADEERTIIVVIEEAHVLNESVLEAIYQLTQNETEATSPIKLIFSGEEQQDDTGLVEAIKHISASEKGRRELFFHTLFPFSLEECKQYLQACFDRQGDLDKIPFNEVDYLRVHQISQGLPGQINSEAKQIMEEGVDRLIGQKNEGGSRWTLASAVAFCLVAGVMIAAYLWDSQPTPRIAQEEKKVLEAETKEVLRTIERKPIVRDEMSEVGNKTAELLSVSQVISTVLQDVNNTPMEQDVIADEATVADYSEEQASVNTDVLSDAPGLAMEKPNEAVSINTVQKNEALISSEEKTVEVAVLQSDAPEPKVVVAPKPLELEKQAQSTDSVIEYTVHEQAIMEFKTSGYTMQMLGSHSQARILKFVSTLPENEELRYFEGVNKGKPWFVLIYGNYKTRAQAVTAVESLPADLKNQKPWIRRVSGVQDAIKARLN